MAVLAIDAGTTGVTCLVVDEASTVTARGYREFPQHYPQPGWVEHDAEEIWAATRAAIADALAAHPGGAAGIDAVGITNQRETVVAWDDSGNPLHRAIVWQDRRTAARCEALRADGTEVLLRDRTGLLADPYFSATKIEWMRREGGVPASARFGTVDAWLIWRLTRGRVHATDVSNASRTLLADTRTLAWSDELCDVFGVDPARLPEIRPSSGDFGTVDPDAVPGLRAPIGGVAGDQQAALFGQACVRPGMVKNTYGTGSFILVNAGAERPEPPAGLVATVAWKLDGAVAYALEGSVFVTGAAIQWLRDELGVLATAADAGPLAASVPDAAGIVVVPAFAGLGAPWWDPHARGAIFGLTRGAGRAHVARAVVEAMALQSRDVIAALLAGTDLTVTELRVDGGASVMDLLCQVQADQLGVTVRRPVNRETTALGAAYLAGLAVGVWSGTGAVESAWREEARFEPTRDRTAADALYTRWHRAVEACRSF